MANFIFGLNTEKGFADIQNPTEALLNLGVDVRDIDVIRGVADNGMTRSDLRRLSGLNFDAKRTLLSIDSDLRTSLRLIQQGITNRSTIPYDLIVDNVVRASAFKYNYVDYNDNNQIKGADISTSRLSSWSSFDSPVTDTSPIFYGGDLVVNSTPATTQSQMRITALDFTDQPIVKKYEAEVPTHLVTLDINGTEKQFYAMQGIPIEFTGFFRNGNVRHRVTDFNGIRPTWEIENLDTGQLTVFENSALDTTNSSLISISDFKSRERVLRFYYPPLYINELNISGIGATFYPNDVLPELVELDISNNEITDLPNFALTAPKLSIINISENPLFSGDSTTANEELNKLPTTITSITAELSFNDNTSIDLSSYTNLQYLSIRGSYSSTYMRDTEYTPIVADSIRTYIIYGSVYTQLHTSVCNSPNLRYVDIQYNNIVSDSDGNDIQIASDNIQYFYSLSNSHNLINFSGKQDLLYYFHRYSRGLINDSTIVDKFNNIPKLIYISLYATDATGDITNEFSNLPGLRILDLRYTRVHGVLSNQSFIGTQEIERIWLGGAARGQDNKTLGQIDGTTQVQANFFENDCFSILPNLLDVIVVSNRNIIGELPDLTQNRRAFRFYITSTGITSGLTKQNGFRNNANLRYLYIIDNRIEEPVPQILSPTVFRVLLDRNLLYGQLLPYECPVANEIRLNKNNIGKDENGNIDIELGSIPTFSACRNLRSLNLADNFFTSYTAGAFKDITIISNLNVSNNKLSISDGFLIIEDLFKNWQANNRGGVSVNLAANNFTEGDILSNPTLGEYYTFLTSVGWSITI